MSATSYPLSWPVGYPRWEGRRKDSQFKPKGLSVESRNLLKQLGMMGVPDWCVIISTSVELRQDGLPYANRKAPDDPGVALFFKMDGEPYAVGSDKWSTVESNMRALVLDIEAMRGRERWGVGSVKQAFAGFKALPQPTPWHEVLSLPANSCQDMVRSRYRQLVKIHHPDKGGDPRRFKEIQAAYEEGMR